VRPKRFPNKRTATPDHPRPPDGQVNAQSTYPTGSTRPTGVFRVDEDPMGGQPEAVEAQQELGDLDGEVDAKRAMSAPIRLRTRATLQHWNPVAS